MAVPKNGEKPTRSRLQVIRDLMGFNALGEAGRQKYGSCDNWVKATGGAPKMTGVRQ
jgi:hypothetical protein